MKILKVKNLISKIEWTHSTKGSFVTATNDVAFVLWKINLIGTSSVTIYTTIIYDINTNYTELINTSWAQLLFKSK